MQVPPSGSHPAGPEPDELPEPPQLRRLRWLVSTLMLALIIGILSVAAVLVIRLGGLSPAPGGFGGPVAAEQLVLPEGAEVLALGQGEGTVLVLLREGESRESLRVFDAESGAVLSTTPIARE